MHYQARNPYLSSAHYSLTAFDSQQSDSFPYAVPEGRYVADLLALPRVLGGPVNITCLASTRPDRMWAMATDRVTLVDTSDGQFRAVATLPLPGVDPVPDDTLAELAATVLTTIEQATEIATSMFGEHPELRVTSGLYTIADCDDVVYSNAGTMIHAIGLADPTDESMGLRVLRSLDATTIFTPFAFPGYPPAVKLIGMTMTYDGHLVIGAFGQLCVVDRFFSEPPHLHDFAPGQLLSNSFSVDDHGGIYVATGAMQPRGNGVMSKLVWTGDRLSTDPADGAWSADYPGGDWAPAVKAGTGTGSTPTLMGFADDEDHLVVITDGRDRMHLLAFWRDALPDLATSRLAGELALTCGQPDETAWIQSEQSVACLDYGALVVNNVTSHGQADRLVDVLVSGPVATPAYGVERCEWDQATRQWRSVWVRPDLASISQVPVISTASRMALINSYDAADGWEVTGMDWDTGATVHRTTFGPAVAGNGAYALVQVLEGGDMIFTSITGPVRVPLSQWSSAM